MHDEHIAGSRGSIFRRTWPADDPDHVAILLHGYGEHIGRYDHVAQGLQARGAAVYGLDHLGPPGDPRHADRSGRAVA